MVFVMQETRRHVIERGILIFALLLTVFLYQHALGQEDPCSKPKVAAVMELVEEGEFVKHLNEQHPSQPRDSWLYQIREKVLEELKMNSPGTQFIPVTGEIPEDCDYYFRYILSLIGAGEDIEVAGLQISEYTAYHMSSKLCSHPRCGEAGRVLNVEITEDEDINHAIERNIADHGDIGARIKEHEETHPVPPRGPEMETSQDREYVSPLEEERKQQIKIDVTNCEGKAVYDKFHGQLVYLPRYTEKGEIEPTKGFPQELLVTDNQVILIIVRPVGASATYTLKKGMQAGQEPVQIQTCGLDNEAVKDIEIHIDGLELKVKPEKKEVLPGDETKIYVDLSEVDENGAKKPVEGKHVQVDVKGLVDGQVYPSGDVITNQNGKVILTYDAGDKDKRIVLGAKFQPNGYPESVEDEAAISIASPAEGVTLEMTNNNEITTEDGAETLSATVTVMLKYSHTESSADEGVFIEYYDVTSWNVGHASATLTAGDHEFETQKVVKNSQLYGNQEDEELLIYFDSKTGKAEKVDLPNTALTFIFDDLNGTQLDGPGWSDTEQEVKGGDGIREMNGGETVVSAGIKSTGVWRIRRFR
jgi:hypothetical protein